MLLMFKDTLVSLGFPNLAQLLKIQHNQTIVQRHMGVTLSLLLQRIITHSFLQPVVQNFFSQQFYIICISSYHNQLASCCCVAGLTSWALADC